MRVLLDTHALLWAVGDPARLGEAARRLISDLDTTLVVSAASAWEIAVKYRLGKLPDAAPFVDDWDAIITRLGAQDLPITAEAAVLAGSLNWTHRDPFDRMLAAQSILERAPLITTDPVFSDVPSVQVRW